MSDVKLKYKYLMKYLNSNMGLVPLKKIMSVNKLSIYDTDGYVYIPKEKMPNEQIVTIAFDIVFDKMYIINENKIKHFTSLHEWSKYKGD